MATRFPFWKPVLPLYSFEQLDYSPFTVKRLELPSDQKIAYIDEGDGPETILFLHGMGNSLTAFRLLIPLLKERFRCIAVDLPGFGKSVKSAADGSMIGYAQTISRFMEKLEIGRAVIAGHSMGGLVAMHMARLFPQRVKDLVLMAPAGLENFNADERNWLLSSMNSLNTQMANPQQIWASVQANFYKMPPEAWFLYTDRLAIQTAPEFLNYCEIIPKCTAAMVDENFLPFLHEIKCPVLLVFGENDGLIPNPIIHGSVRLMDVVESVSMKIPDISVKWLPQCGHFIPLERPAELAGMMSNFLN